MTPTDESTQTLDAGLRAEIDALKARVDALEASAAPRATAGTKPAGIRPPHPEPAQNAAPGRS